jgi:CDP-diacylglycerol---serine O-phosphatidyltransferase
VARRRDPAKADRESLPFLHLLPNLVTILGLCVGLTAIRFAFEDRFEVAAALIIFAAVIDGLDGLVARRLKATSSFGAELDSLSDFVCFGVAPGLLVYRFALGDEPGLGWVFVLAFVICCCLRLARFNISRDQPLPEGVRPHFVGVPAPSAAMLALLPVFATLAGLADLREFPVPVALYLGLVGLMMISRVPTLSPKALRISRDRARWVLVGMALLVGLMLTRFWLLMVLAVLAYVATLLWAALRYRRRRK